MLHACHTGQTMNRAPCNHVLMCATKHRRQAAGHRTAARRALSRRTPSLPRLHLHRSPCRLRHAQPPAPTRPHRHRGTRPRLRGTGPPTLTAGPCAGAAWVRGRASQRATKPLARSRPARRFPIAATPGLSHACRRRRRTAGADGGRA